MIPRDVLVQCREKDIKLIRLWYIDLQGWSHAFLLPATSLSAESFDSGYSLNAMPLVQPDSAEGGDLWLVPQSETAWVDPVAAVPTLHLIASLYDPLTGIEHELDSRSLARRAVSYLEETGVADRAIMAVLVRFFITAEAEATGDRRCVPETTMRELESSLMMALLDSKGWVDASCVAGAEQPTMQYQLASAEMVRAADRGVYFRHLASYVAGGLGCKLEFRNQQSWAPMPEVLGKQNWQFGLYRGTESVIAGRGPAGLSETGIHALGGILRHLPSLVTLSRGPRHSSTGTPASADQDHAPLPPRSQGASNAALRLDFPEADCNPYVAMSAVLMAAIDGIQSKILPGDPPSQSLDSDQEFLTRGNVFSQELIQHWLQRHGQSDPTRSC